jgi:hypothetical protein
MAEVRDPESPTTLKQRTRASRQAGLTRFIDRAPALLAALESAGLRDSSDLSVERVETILIEDPFWCDACEGTPEGSDRVCPNSGRPHRRFLVMVAEALLKLVGEARATTLPPSAGLAPRPGDQKHNDGMVVRRGVPINPQLLLLAYHAAADAEMEPVHRELARHLVQNLELLKQALAMKDENRDRVTPAQRQHVGRLVVSFARAWREYLRVAATIARSVQSGAKEGELGPVTSPMTPMTPIGFRTKTTTVEHAQHELVKSAVETYGALSDLQRNIQHQPKTAESTSASQIVQEQMDAVERRIERIGGQTGLAELHRLVGVGRDTKAKPRPEPLENLPSSISSESDTERKPSQEAPAVVPAGGLTPHVHPRYRNAAKDNRIPAVTSASDNEGFSSHADDRDEVTRRKFEIRRTTPMGPSLPPNWSVGRDGRSRPPPQPAPHQVAAQKRAELEFKVKTSLKARWGLKQVSAQQTTPGDQAKRNVTAQVEETLWTAFREELGATPPNASRIPHLLRVVGDGLVEALPKKLRQRVGQEILDTFDWSTKKQGASSVLDTRSMVDVLQYVVDRIVEYGAPVRAAQVQREADSLKERIKSATLAGNKDTIADVVVEAMKFMFASVRRLHEDIAAFGMTIIAPELAKSAVASAKEFVRDWLPPLSDTSWASSKTWALSARDAAIRAGSIVASGQFSHSDTESIVAHGLIALCASAKKAVTSRWADYPTNVLYFERPAVFASANTLQFCTLRLMITSTAALLLAQPNRKTPGKPKLPAPQVQELIASLDAHLRMWLGMAPSETGETDVLSLTRLKDEVTGDINHALLEHNHDAIQGRQVAVGDVVLGDADVRVLQNVLDKVARTDSNEYIAFEQRITAAVSQAVQTQLRPARLQEENADSDDDRAAVSSPKPSPFERLAVVEKDLQTLVDDLCAVATVNVEINYDIYTSFFASA